MMVGVWALAMGFAFAQGEPEDRPGERPGGGRGPRPGMLCHRLVAESMAKAAEKCPDVKAERERHQQATQSVMKELMTSVRDKVREARGGAEGRPDDPRQAAQDVLAQHPELLRTAAEKIVDEFQVHRANVVGIVKANKGAMVEATTAALKDFVARGPRPRGGRGQNGDRPAGPRGGGGQDGDRPFGPRGGE